MLLLGIWVLAGLTVSHARAADPEPVRLVDKAPSLGLSDALTYGGRERNDYILETTGSGVAVFDFDNDGDNDLYFAPGSTFALQASGKNPAPKLYRNDGDIFVEVARQAGLNRSGWGQGVCIGDFDNDGYADLFNSFFEANALYRNNGDGTFSDYTARAGLSIKDKRWGSGCAFLDYDNDGRLDLFVANYVDLDLEKTPKPGSSSECEWKGLPVMCGPRGLPRALNVLYHNEGDGRFTDVSESAGILAPGGRYGLGALAADFDNDGLVDIYVACDMTPSLLYRNNGDGTFEDIADLAGVAYNVDGQLQAGMGVAAADFDGNGYLDLVKTNFSGDLPSLYRNEDGDFFEDVSLAAGLGVNQYLGWGVLFEDFDEDGLADILMAHGHVYPEVEGSSIGEKYRQPTILYRNLGEGRFADISSEAGPALTTPRPSRGVAAGDLDGDGRPEIVIINVNAPPSVLFNDAPAGGSRLWLRLHGKQSNRSAIGAQVKVSTEGRTQRRDVVGGGSYYAQSDLALHFGLGGAAEADVEVRWPSGNVQRFAGLAAGRYILTEGEPPAAVSR
ncbi:MAG: CRTAC1 family protein [Acidobacteria bacterium]|nr:CRTAC1 family protein [Acidobacteriota bacterium]